MEVVAIKQGYFGGRFREKGDKFDVPKNVTGTWFEPVEKPTGTTTAVAPKATAADDLV